MRKSIIALISLLLFSWAGAVPDTLNIKLGNSLEIGKDAFVFASIAGVSEDKGGNFYVADRLERKVLKFSRTGEKLLEFGQPGRGPGDFSSPGRIAVTENGNLAVSEDMYDISIHNPEGEFIERVHLSGRLSPGYIGPECFYSWYWKPDSRQQAVVDRENNVLKNFYSIPKNLFSVSAPDETGRRVMFNYGPDVYAPDFLFDHKKTLSAVAVSSRYEIILLDSRGKISAKIQRDTEPPKLSKTEINFFKQEIRKTSRERGWPDRVARDLQKLIPKRKMYFNRILLSGQYVFVFRIPEDVTMPDSPVPVDVFSAGGHFLGSSRLPETAVHVSEEFMYFIRADEKGNVYLVRSSYRIN